MAMVILSLLVKFCHLLKDAHESTAGGSFPGRGNNFTVDRTMTNRKDYPTADYKFVHGRNLESLGHTEPERGHVITHSRIQAK
jgi:hypothetical protein